MSTRASGSLALIVAALRSDFNAGAWMRQAQSADPEKLVVTAIVLGVAPLLAYHLEQSSVALPARAQAKLLSARSASAIRQQSILAQLSEILEAANHSAIEVIVLKGAYLATHVYPQPGLRAMNDIDLLVRPERLGAMEDVLRGLGYEGHYKDPQRGARVTKHTSSFRRGTAEASAVNPYLEAGSDRTIEPHVSLAESWYGLRADVTPGTWQRSVPVEFDGRAARALCPSDLMLHLCVHLAFHVVMGYPSLMQMVDLLMVIPLLTANDWRTVAARAMERKAGGFVYAALRLAHHGLGAVVPAETLSQLAAATPLRLRAYVDTLTIENVTQRAQRPPITNLRQRLARGVAERAEAARWASSAPERLAVWWTLVDVTRTDTGHVLGARLWRVGKSPR